MFKPKYILAFCVCIITAIGFSQNNESSNSGNAPAPGKIKGIVIDNSSKLPIEFATIVLFNVKDSSMVTGVIAGNKGDFQLSDIPFGRYYMKLNFIGYEQLVIDSIAIRPKMQEIDLGKVKLKTSAAQLGEVEVSTEKSTVQLGIDKKVFDVEKNIIAQGGSVNDVLQTIPSVSVDIDGNVSLRGNGNVTVLIDGKPSAITGSSRAAILQQIPASTIESIELITNPSARYDPEGMSGIINIITKKNKLSGFNSSLIAGVGTGDKYNASASVSYRTSKFNVYATYGFRSDNRIGYGNTYRQNFLADTTFFLRQDFNSLNKNVSNNVTGGIDFYLNDKNTLTLSSIFNTGSVDYHETINYTEADENDITSATFNRDVIRNTNPDRSNNTNLFYRKTFAKPKREFIIDATYSDASKLSNESYTESDYTLLYDYKNDAPFKQTTETETNINLISAQIDYTTPLKYDIKWDVGGKATLRNIDNDFKSSLYDYSENNFMPDSNLSNNFIYSENIYAAYTILGGRVKKLGYQLGVRAEEVRTTSDLVTTNEKFNYNYFNLFPSAHLSQKIKETNEVQVSYSKRINRPNSNELNPFRNYSDPYNIQFGNPYLKPEYVHSYELSYLNYLKKGVITTSAYYRQTDGVIQRYKILADSTSSLLTFVNLNQSQTYGLEFILKTDVVKWWNVTFSLNGYQTIIDGSNVQTSLQNKNLSYLIKFLSNMRVWKNMDIQLVANYNGPRAWIQGEIRQVFAMDVGIKKEIFKNASLSLNIADIFNTRQFVIKSDKDPSFALDMTRKRESRVATLNFSYRFGKMTDKKVRQEKQNPAGEGGGDFGM